MEQRFRETSDRADKLQAELAEAKRSVEGAKGSDANQQARLDAFRVSLDDAASARGGRSIDDTVSARSDRDRDRVPRGLAGRDVDPHDAVGPATVAAVLAVMTSVPALASPPLRVLTINVWSGLRVPLDDNPNYQHWSGAAAAATGISPTKQGEFDSKSIDQQIADSISHGARFKSVAAAAEKAIEQIEAAKNDTKID